MPASMICTHQQVAENEHNDDSVIHIEVRDHTPRDHMIFENQASIIDHPPFSPNNSSESLRSVFLRQSSSSPEDRNTPVNHIHSPVLHSQQDHGVEVIETADDAFVQSPHVPIKSESVETSAVYNTRQEKVQEEGGQII